MGLVKKIDVYKDLNVIAGDDNTLSNDATLYNTVISNINNYYPIAKTITITKNCSLRFSLTMRTTVTNATVRCQIYRSATGTILKEFGTNGSTFATYTVDLTLNKGDVLTFRVYSDVTTGETCVVKDIIVKCSTVFTALQNSKILTLS